VMAIIVDRIPHVVVTDQESGWSLTGGTEDGDGYQTREMSHPSGARCTIQLTVKVMSREEIVLAIIGMIYLNPGEERGTFLRKLPQAGDFIGADALYALAPRLIRAWYEATFTTMPPLRIEIPKQ
jgi:hypothetical protein